MPDKNLGFLLCIQALSSKSEMTHCGFAKKLLETVNPWRQNDGFMEKKATCQRSEATCHSFVKSFSGVNPRNKMAASSA